MEKSSHARKRKSEPEKKLVNFSDRNREISQQVDPETGEKVQLLTKKQFLDLQKKELKSFD